MRTAILLAGMLIGASLGYICNRPLTKKEEELNTKFNKVYVSAIWIAIAMDAVEFFMEVL